MTGLASTYEGLRVLDLSTNIAGPFCAMVLGDFGADVIKVERSPAGDDTRSLPPFRDGGEATVFEAVNRSKRSVVLDLRQPEARDALLRLVATADVVIESFGPGVARKLGLTFDDFAAANPRIILCTVSAFGEGPIGGRLPGYDALVQAVSGMMALTGHPGDPPVRVGPSVVDLSTGMWALVGIMAALSRPPSAREATHIQPSLLDSAVTLMCHQVLGHLATGAEPEKLGSQAPSAAPYAVFTAADGDLMVATANDAQFTRLCEVLDAPELAREPAFRTVADRIARRDALMARLAPLFGSRTVDEWLDALAHARISAGRVNSLGGALAAPLTRERGLVVQPDASWPPQLRLPIDRDAVCVRRPPPALGEHSTEVLESIGLDPDAIIRVSGAATAR